MSTRFLHGHELTAAIRDILAETDVRAAVAFWGRGCEEWVAGSNARIIANLRMGGTNPHALKKLKGRLKRCDRLHAKVFVGHETAVVASANVSINGLALEGAEAASWIEAGIVTSDIALIAEWFEDLWEDGAHEIIDADWKRAEDAWKLRSRAKPTLESFADFDVGTSTLPLVTWIDGSTWTVNDREVADQLGHFDEAVKDRVDAGIGVNHPDDEPILKDRWVLCWRSGERSGTMKGMPWFAETSGTVVRNAFSYDHDGRMSDVVLAPERGAQQPFDPNEPRFLAALRKTLRDPTFKRLHDDENDGEGWFAARQPLLRLFWTRLRRSYDEDALTKG